MIIFCILSTEWVWLYSAFYQQSEYDYILHFISRVWLSSAFYQQSEYDYLLHFISRVSMIIFCILSTVSMIIFCILSAEYDYILHFINRVSMIIFILSVEWMIPFWILSAKWMILFWILSAEWVWFSSAFYEQRVVEKSLYKLRAVCSLWTESEYMKSLMHFLVESAFYE